MIIRRCQELGASNTDTSTDEDGDLGSEGVFRSTIRIIVAHDGERATAGVGVELNIFTTTVSDAHV